jgi:hypothetical protein
MYKTHEQYVTEFRTMGFGLNEAHRAARLEVIEDHALEADADEAVRDCLCEIINFLKEGK